MDHEEYLGHTLASIASEKAAIIRPGVTAVIGQSRIPRHSPYCWNAVTSSASNRHSIQTSAVYATDKTSLSVYVGRTKSKTHRSRSVWPRRYAAWLHDYSTNKFALGLRGNTPRPSRLRNNPPFLLDGAHNPAGAQALRNYLDELEPRSLTLIFGAMRDKKLDQIAQILFPLADRLILTVYRQSTLSSIETLASLAKQFAPGLVIENHLQHRSRSHSHRPNTSRRLDLRHRIALFNR